MRTVSMGLRTDVSLGEAKKFLLTAFGPFGSLTPVANKVADNMIAVVDGDRSALGHLAEALASARELEHWVQDLPTFRFSWWEVTIVTPTSGTEITLLKGEGVRPYRAHIHFGPKGSACRAKNIREALAGFADWQLFEAAA